MEITIGIVATAAIAGLTFSRIPAIIWRGSVDCSGPTRSSVSTTSSKLVANAKRAPDPAPGKISGNVTQKK